MNVFDGNTSDPSSFRSVIELIEATQDRKQLTLTVDRGKISAFNVEKLHETGPNSLYAAVIRSSRTGSPVEAGNIRPKLFDGATYSRSGCTPAFSEVLKGSPTSFIGPLGEAILNFGDPSLRWNKFFVR